MTRAPREAAISWGRSVEPVSTTTIEAGFATDTIAAILGVRPASVSRWFAAHQTGGLPALPGDRTGRPVGSGRLLSLDQEAHVEALILVTNPTEHGLIGTEEEPHFASVAEGLRTFRARHLLGMIYQDQGRFAEAEAQWRAALHDKPDFTPTRLVLKELLLAPHRLVERKE